MVRGDNDSDVSAGTSPKEEAEIDRIIKEIEDLEKKMDSSEPDTTSDAGALSESTDIVSDALDDDSESAKVYAIRLGAENDSDSLAETDAVPASREPLLKSDIVEGDGTLAMKIGGCAEVSLEFSKAGIQVTLTCNDEVLCITTDQGAEFRVPFKKVA